ncbi:thioesterase family protein [Amycolatopsis sp. FDAARGOS 1241]|uniref:acyl-CoA thioesterase n=1 Tax=Amycolatopsis sp. FDAARGOS 1241 TaxID=2778070 RepID=UPI00194E72B7|nr:acyl-CoA thioesterase [Amycolatopsis sp. FDAARGOS 1241]QRP44946.1 acyl-CoA thioesterase [Amycolatopsis sp. FDAARGOS 1241]
MTDREPFRTRIKVRHYELDSLGHLNHAVYHSYGEVSRIELFESAGDARLRDQNLAPVLLESHIVYRRELRGGDVVDVSCDASFGDGKVFWMTSRIVKLDGTLSAEITCTVGLMDLVRRKLVEDPRGHFERAGLNLKVLSTAE